MLLQIDDIVDGSVINTDLVIIGAGAAGITLARSLVGSHLNVTILESGGLEFDQEIQDLYSGRVIGGRTEALDVSRLRFLGGSTNHWAGWCRPLEVSDFTQRPDWSEDGWPFSRKTLEPYYRRAAKVCQLGPDRFDDLEFWSRENSTRLNPLELDPDRLKTAVFQVSPPTRFGELYQSELAKSENVTVVLSTTAIEIIGSPGTDPDQLQKTVSGVLAGSLSGRRFTVNARAVVLAVGGLETSRLLLLSTGVHPTGVGNEHDLVGRYFLDHPWMRGAAFLQFSIEGTNWPLYFRQHEIAGARIFGALCSTPRRTRSEGTGAFRLVLRSTTMSSAGIDSLKRVFGNLKQGRIVDNLDDHLGNIIGDLDMIADAGYRRLFGADDSIFIDEDDETIRGALVDLNFEQRPNPDSRILLDTEVDAFEMRRIALDWRLGETDRRTAIRALELFSLEMGRIGAGRVKLIGGMDELESAWPPDMTGSRHHCGGARMSEDPNTGVTDSWGRIHSCENLYVSGSALFPTEGYANPTLTIVALALRQAEHLLDVFG